MLMRERTCFWIDVCLFPGGACVVVKNIQVLGLDIRGPRYRPAYERWFRVCELGCSIASDPSTQYLLTFIVLFKPDLNQSTHYFG
jgi:hypothetical protein